MSGPAPLDGLARILGPGGVALDETARLACARDSWPQALAWDDGELRAHAPSAVLRPADEAGVLAVLSWAAERGVAVVPRGAGSGVLGAAVPESSGAVVLDLSRLDDFELRADAREPVARAGAGWRGGALERRLNALGWSLMNFPQSMEDSSAGGWISTDAFGQLSTRWGGVRAQVRGVRVAGLDGRAAAEPAEPHLGAEGTLGALTEVTLRVRPLPRARSFAAFDFGDLPAALDWARRALTEGAPPSVLRLYGPVDALFNGLRRSGRGGADGPLKRRLETLLLRRPGCLNAVASLARERWLAVVVCEDEAPYGAAAPSAPRGAKSLGEGPARKWWERRYRLSKERLEGVFASGCFVDTADFRAPWELLPRLDAQVQSALREHAFCFSHLSHFDAAGACLYVTFAGAGRDAHARAWAAALDAGAGVGASVNHHHGVGLAKRAWLGSAWRAERVAAWRADKARRDPRGLLNPGKLCP